ncbi:hypothetical protein C8J56DRAFT_1173972 [Mycena floridula]|nr:hypothetical protein C8J56DRAFT_1173972 [Mycena floridula]
MKRGFLVKPAKSSVPDGQKESNCAVNPALSQNDTNPHPGQSAIPDDQAERYMPLVFGTVHETVPSDYVSKVLQPSIWSEIPNSENNKGPLIVTRLPPNSHISTICLVNLDVRDLIVAFPGFPTDLPSQVTPAYRIAQTTDRGLAMFATRKMVSGELILVERPLLVAPISLRLPPDTDLDRYSMPQLTQILMYEMNRMLRVAVEEMSQKEKQDFMTLTNCHKGDGSGPLLGIQRTNSIRVLDGIKNKGMKGREGGYIAILKDGSRINHSCNPNVGYNWDTASFSVKFYVQRDIEDGEEITRSYLGSLLGSCTERQKALEPLGFRCICSACLHPEISDPRRKRIGEMQDWRHQFIEWSHDPTLPDDLLTRPYSEYLQLCEVEELQASSSHTTCCAVLSMCYMMLADKENFIKYRRMEAISSGDESKLDDIANVETMTLWGYRNKRR